MAENYQSCSQDSPLLSEESCMLLFHLNGCMSQVDYDVTSGAPPVEYSVATNVDALSSEDYSTMVTTVNTPVVQEDPVVMPNLDVSAYPNYSSGMNARIERPVEVNEMKRLVQQYTDQICNNCIQPDTYGDLYPQVIKKARSSLPACENWAGEYNFRVSFYAQENVKGVQWIFSTMKNKLYVGKDVPCPINFSTNPEVSAPGVYYIRAMALFSNADQASDIVHRCINHSMEEFNKKVKEAEHLVRSFSSVANYEEDPVTGRHSVTVPFENPPVGQHFSTYLYKFTCFGSCSGGPNRRPMMLVFTLEKGGAVIGRQIIDLKVCACPSRDMRADEKHANETVKRIKTDSHQTAPPEKRKSHDETPPGSTSETVQKKMKKSKRNCKEEDEKKKYVITVDSKKCYEFLMEMKKYFAIIRYLKSNGHGVSKDLLSFVYSSLSSEEDEISEQNSQQ